MSQRVVGAITSEAESAGPPELARGFKEVAEAINHKQVKMVAQV